MLDDAGSARTLCNSLEVALKIYEEQRRELGRDQQVGEAEHARAMQELAGQAAGSATAPRPVCIGGAVERLEKPQERSAERAAAQKARWIRLEEALSVAELSLLRLSHGEQVDPVKESIHAAISCSRLIRAEGAPDLADIRERLRPVLRTELAHSRDMLAHAQSLQPDAAEEQAAPMMREGLQRSMAFLGQMHAAMRGHEALVREWQDRQESALREALELARGLQERLPSEAIPDAG
jgi:hypothetical protein